MASGCSGLIRMRRLMRAKSRHALRRGDTDLINAFDQASRRHSTGRINPVQPFLSFPMTTQQLSARASELRRQAASCPLFVATMLIERAEELERKARQGQSDGRN